MPMLTTCIVTLSTGGFLATMYIRIVHRNVHVNCATPLRGEFPKNNALRTFSARSHSLPIKSVTSDTHLSTCHTLPGWLFNSIGGQNYDLRTIYCGALLTDIDTSIFTPQLLWAHSVDLRHIFCGPKFVLVRVMHASVRSSVHRVSR
jgi:hypothetical protein